MFTGREPEVVVDQLMLKVKYAKQAEEVARTQYHKQWEVVERKVEKGTRKNKKLREKVMRKQHVYWEKLTNKYDKKVDNLVKKFNVKNKVKTKKEVEEDEILEGILLEDSDLNKDMEGEVEPDIPIFGEIN